MVAIFTWTPFPFAYLTIFLACVLAPVVSNPGRRHRRVFFFPILLLSIRLQYDGEAGYATSTTWFVWLLMASDVLLLTDVQIERELYRLEDSGSGRRSKRTTGSLDRKPLLQRVTWALDVFCTSGRGVGWGHQPRHLRPHLPEISKATFLIQRTLLLLASICIFDLVNAQLHWNPAFCARLGLASTRWFWRIAGTASWAALAVTSLSIPHIMLSIGAVGLNISRPRDWPLLFGGLEDMASVRTFWARGWHQILRRSLTAHGRYLANTVLKLPPRSLSSLCVVISTAFVLSGLIHNLGERVPLNRVGYSGGSLIFFSIQPLAIGLETLFALCFRHTAISTQWRRTLGLAWVFAWFALTLPIMQDPLLRSGELEPRLHVSFVVWAVGRGWDLTQEKNCSFE
ncbi:BTB domain-containing protein [Mycena indigotica]|uniref:BTB domain-containing protein n=1 Tax=Mycena indigotica TaxID=2126181 RepID=A0A8H6TDD1_9AGAR|nr:BTB domain-containing protein [Mycena indigotica]KAF7315623.1 BTB domain-containing protein [Mycena indigotica]